MNEPEFEYDTQVYAVNSKEDLSEMAIDVARKFNGGWKPTTNGPALVIPMVAPGSRYGGQRWLLMYVFAKEKSHGHD